MFLCWSGEHPNREGRERNQSYSSIRFTSCKNLSCVSFSSPSSCGGGYVFDRLGDVLRLEIGFAFEVGDDAGPFEDAVVGAGAEALLGHGAFDEAYIPITKPLNERKPVS